VNDVASVGPDRLCIVAGFSLMMVDLGATSADVDPNWNTAGYSAACASWPDIRAAPASSVP